MKSKAVKIFLSVFLVIILIAAILSSLWVVKEIEKKKDIEKKIDNILKEEEQIESLNENYKLDIEKKKVELKEKLEEEDIWKKTEEKINQAL